MRPLDALLAIVWRFHFPPFLPKVGSWPLGAIAWLLLALAWLGHAVVWVYLVNRIHAFGWPRYVIKAVSFVMHVCQVAIPIGIALWWIQGASVTDAAPVLQTTDWQAALLHGYLSICCLVALVHVPRWARRITARPPQVLRHQTSRLEIIATASSPGISGSRAVHGWYAELLSRVPGNQIFQIEVSEKTLAIARLPPALEGLSIAHISDSHFSGRMTREFFDAIVQQVNAMDVDLVALTGDICDRTACVEWIRPVLGALRSRLGTFSVLGNHDLKLRDEAGLRAALASAGCIDLGQRYMTVSLRGEKILLAGNELPWFAPRVKSDAWPQVGENAASLKILLSHSPDQWHWARRRGFDLVLAGHVHGGQIRIPGIGPIFCPSLYGVDYASGTFFAPPTVLHVSRGVSSMLPLRWNCRPEISKLVLTGGK